MNLRQSPGLLCEHGLFLFSHTFTAVGLVQTKLRCEVAPHAELSGAQTGSYYQVIPESRQSMESSWNVGKHSGRKAMLSQLGGAATTSSGPACSPDSQSGNSRQDKTHPDTPTAPTRLHHSDRWGWSFARNALSSSESFCCSFFFFSSLTLVVKISVSRYKRSAGCLGDSRSSCVSCQWLFSAYLCCQFYFRTEIKPDETASAAFSHWFLNLFSLLCNHSDFFFTFPLRRINLLDCLCAPSQAPNWHA